MYSIWYGYEFFIIKVIEIIDAMKYIKIILVIPLFFICSMRTFAINKDSVVTVILDLLDKKHCYEVSLNTKVIKYSSESKPFKDVFLIDKTKCENTLIALSNYENAISIIKSDKNLLLFIGDEINKGNKSLFNEKYIFYNYNSVYNIEERNKMTYLDFFKVIKNCLFELDMSVLPSMESAFEGCNCDSLIAEVFNVLKLKHNYEASMICLQKKDELRPNVFKDVLEVYSAAGIVVGDVETSLKEYNEMVEKIKLHKEKYILCIENRLNNDNTSMILYYYEFPLNSIIDKESIMKRKDFLKVFKHFIFDLDKGTLPPLKDAVEYLKNN